MRTERKVHGFTITTRMAGPEGAAGMRLRLREDAAGGREQCVSL
jgi:hypothetical protein